MQDSPARSASTQVSRPQGSRWVKRGLIALVLFASVGAIGAVATRSMPKSVEAPELTYKVRRGKLSVTVTENGMVESSNNKEIKCLVKGGSTVLWVIETGTYVKPGDELVKLDTSNIEDAITQREIAYENALANKIITESDVAVAEKSITEYLEGTYVEEKSTIEKEIFDAERAVTQAELAYRSSVRLAAKGLIKSLQLEGDRHAVDSAKKELALKKTKLMALEKYKKEKQLQQLKSTLKAAQARLASDEASLKLEKARLDREKQQLENCIIRAETAGMVIFPSAAEWKETPDIEQGATVREQQTLLMIPDVSQMQVKVGVHESKVHRLNIGMKADVQLQEVNLTGSVAEIAEVTRPAGWWTGNMVKYDTIIKLDNREGLKPGMSAVVDIVLAEYDDVLTVPVSAVVEIEKGHVCWIQGDTGLKLRKIVVGDTDDEFVIVKEGLAEGDVVVLNPMAFIDEAQKEAILPSSKSEADEDDKSVVEDGKKTAKSSSSDTPSSKEKFADAKPKKASAKAKTKSASPSKAGK